MSVSTISTHKPKRDQRLARHKNVKSHFTSTHSSWLNQIENLVLDPKWQIPEARLIRLVSPSRRNTSMLSLRHSTNARPFAWTRSKIETAQTVFADQ
jgi:hypothetical protein